MLFFIYKENKVLRLQQYSTLLSIICTTISQVCNFQFGTSYNHVLIFDKCTIPIYTSFIGYDLIYRSLVFREVQQHSYFFMKKTS